MKTFLIFVAAGFLVACSSSATDDEKIVKRLERIALTFQSTVDAKEPEISAPYYGPNKMLREFRKEWYLRKIHVVDVGYDVKKTDSLVSPYTGEISYSVVTQGRRGASEKDVKEGPENFKTPGEKCRATYAYQSSRWVRKSVACLSFENIWETPSPLSGSKYVASELLPQE